MNSGTSTNVSLLLRLKQEHRSQAAWVEFVQRYGGRIHQWCLLRKLQPADAEDVTQNVLVKLARATKTFEYDSNQTFRGWLRTITENAVRDFFRDYTRQKPAKGGSSYFNAASLAAAPKELAAQLEEAFDLELLEQAMANVKARVTQHRWNAWYLTAWENGKAADVAARLQMKIANVYTAKNQIQTMIRDEISSLENNALDTRF